LRRLSGACHNGRVRIDNRNKRRCEASPGVLVRGCYWIEYGGVRNEPVGVVKPLDDLCLDEKFLPNRQIAGFKRNLLR